MVARTDLDLYNVLLGFGRLRERVELVRATIDPGFLLRAPSSSSWRGARAARWGRASP